MTEYQRGISDALKIAQSEEQKWLRAAEKHARNYWGGMKSDCAKRDLERARIARRISEKLISLKDGQ